MEIFVSPDPATRGEDIHIKVTGGTGASVVLKLTDLEGHEAEVTVQLDGGSGGEGWTVPSDWGASIILTAPDGTTTTVGVN